MHIVVHGGLCSERVHPRLHVCVVVVEGHAKGCEGEMAAEEPDAFPKMARVSIKARPEPHELWYRFRFKQLGLPIPTTETVGLELEFLGRAQQAVISVLQYVCVLSGRFEYTKSKG